MTKKLIGKLIRKKTISGKPIGPYLMVLMSNRWQSYVVYLEGRPKAIFLKKKNIYQVKELNLPLELKTFKRVQDGAQTKIQHSVTTTYNKLFTKEFEVLRFFTSYGDYAYFKCEKFEKKRDIETGRFYIEITLGEMIWSTM